MIELDNDTGIPTRRMTNAVPGVSAKESLSEVTKKNYSKYGKKYFADAVRKSAHNNKDKINKRFQERYRNPLEKEKILTRQKTRDSNEKTGICNDCKQKKKTEFHHLTYNPNIFIEVCKKCHNKRHGRELYV